MQPTLVPLTNVEERQRSRRPSQQLLLWLTSKEVCDGAKANLGELDSRGQKQMLVVRTATTGAEIAGESCSCCLPSAIDVVWTVVQGVESLVAADFAAFPSGRRGSVGRRVDLLITENVIECLHQSVSLHLIFAGPRLQQPGSMRRPLMACCWRSDDSLLLVAEL